MTRPPPSVKRPPPPMNHPAVIPSEQSALIYPERLYPTPAVMDMPTRKSRKTPAAVKTSIDLGPHLSIYIYPDGTGGGMAPKAIARMEVLEHDAIRRIEQMKKSIELLEQWLKLPKRESVELWT